MKIKNIYDRDVKFWIVGAVMLSCIIQVLEIFVTKSPIILELSDVQNEFHMDILTVNSIFCGFELTSLGILVSLTSDDAVKKLKGTEVVYRRNKLIMISISFCTLSMMASLFFILGSDKKYFEFIHGEKIIECIFKIELISLVFGVAFFLGTIKKMIDVLQYVYKVPRRYESGKRQKILDIQRESISGQDETDENDIF